VDAAGAPPPDPGRAGSHRGRTRCRPHGDGTAAVPR
jgi:hypothetical protein